MSKFDRETKRNEFFSQRDRELDELIDPKTGKVRADLVEKINCPLCGYRRYNVLFTKNGFDFVRCQKCTLVYVNPRLLEEKIIAYYDDNSLSNIRALEFLASSKEQEYNCGLYKFYYDEIKKVIPWGRLLDVGCSAGQFLKMGQDLGYEVLGLELNEMAARYAEKNFGVKIERKLLEECDFSEASFDIISMFGVIEHLTDLIGVMKEVVRILKPGGLFVGRCPNVQGLVCAILHSQARTFSGRIHLMYFSEKTLRELFKKVGFKRVEIDTFVSGKDSLLNYFQFLDPFGDEKYDYLPDKFQKFILNKNNFKKLEKKMNELGLGYKLRFFAQK